MWHNLVEMDWLVNHLHDPGVRIIDCRFILGEAEAGREAYDEGHLPGALYFDLEKDLSAPRGVHGGRHPLPDLEELSRKLGEAGISENTKVIAYDDQGGVMACRFWWTLKYLGHHEVFVLNGTFSLWQDRGFPVTAELPLIPATAFKPRIQPQLLCSMEEVKSKHGQQGVVLIDSRDSRRYLGIDEPIDSVAGHIPDAVNYFWREGLNEDDTWKPLAEQKKRFAALEQTQEIIVYCGSGITACPNFLALLEAGFNRVNLYLGSWSDWYSYPDNEITRDKGTRDKGTGSLSH